MATDITKDIVRALVASNTIQELWKVWQTAMTSFGLERVMYGQTRFASGLNTGDPGDFFILTNFCPDYVQGYMETKLFFHAPMLRWAMANVGAKSWGDIWGLIDQGSLTAKEIEVIEFNKSFGINAGYTISFQTHAMHGRAAVSLAGGPHKTQDEVDAIWRDKGTDIQLINEVAHLKVMALPHTTISGQKLTDRQREVLQWVSDGKTTQDIAILMDVSKATVEKHLRLARQVLGVETTAQAVLRLAYQNQIFRLD